MLCVCVWTEYSGWNVAFMVSTTVGIGVVSAVLFFPHCGRGHSGISHEPHAGGYERA